MRHKHDVLTHFQTLYITIKNMFGTTIKYFESDGVENMITRCLTTTAKIWVFTINSLVLIPYNKMGLLSVNIDTTLTWLVLF